ncbi:PREDICTED: copper chaperone for superoxide dismutase [Elephantulus edwardii]|uniref:copper chaperone for superoxide dismutase n=1 Tax=Elephantulus edwardii TaxID=28737 RepID=UPI0003F0B629|nr:PREDICTED: copper chaperone for superoxide dismutase [Elephantulus edwardii]
MTTRAGEASAPARPPRRQARGLECARATGRGGGYLPSLRVPSLRVRGPATGRSHCAAGDRRHGRDGVDFGRQRGLLQGESRDRVCSSLTSLGPGCELRNIPGLLGTPSRLEFAVQMTCQSCVDAVHKSLQGVAGVHSVEVQLENQMVLVETTLPSTKVQALLEGTGRQAVLKGMGNNLLQNLEAAVAILGGLGPVQGVVRFLQLNPERCLIEGTVDGLEPGPHGLHVHQYGDLTNSCDSCGDHFNPDGTSHGGPQDAERHRGDLGNVHADADGRAVFRMEVEKLKVWEVIGRSLVIDEKEDDLGRGGHPLSKITGNSGQRLACGIIARSAGLFQNPKQICSCDGLTIWEERGRPIAGEGRKGPVQRSAHL